MDVDPKHTWVLPRNSKVIRFYMWLWEASPSQVNFCKLFWGYIFAIPNLLVRVVAFPFVVVVRLVKPWIPTREPEVLTQEEEEQRMKERVARLEKREARWQRILDRIENAGVHVVWFFSAVWRYARYPVVVIAGLLLLGGLGVFVYLLTTAWWGVTWKVVVYAVGSAIVCLAVAVPLAIGLIALSERGKLNWVDRVLVNTLAVIIAPFVFFFWVMKMGFISVKTNTCPRVELRD